MVQREKYQVGYVSKSSQTRRQCSLVLKVLRQKTMSTQSSLPSEHVFEKKNEGKINFLQTRKAERIHCQETHTIRNIKESSWGSKMTADGKEEWYFIVFTIKTNAEVSKK